MKAGYKQTEVGIIPEDWDVKPLSLIADKIMVGIASAATHAYRDKGVPMFRNQNIKVGFLEDSDLLFIDPEYEVAFKNKRLRGGDLLTARTGYPGVTAIVPPEYDSAQSFTTLITRPNPSEVRSDYLCHFINSEAGQRFFTRSQIGGAQKNLNAGLLRGMPIPLPKEREQCAIADALSDVDALLHLLDQTITKKRDLKQAAMQQLLTGQTRLPGFHGEWEVKQIGDFTDCKAGGTPSTRIPIYWGGSIRWMSSGELHLKRVYEVEGRITELGLSNSSAQMIPRNCVLVGLAGQGKTRGTVAMNCVELCTNQSIAAIFPNPTFVPDYLYYNLDFRYAELRELSTGAGGRGGLNLTIIKAIPIPFPSFDEQLAIAAVLSEMDTELTLLEQRLTKTRDLKQGMMQELLTGKTRLV